MTEFAVDATHLRRQRAFSRRTFGPGDREAGVLDHISKELREIETATTPEDKLSEWVDVVILALDGALRGGADPWRGRSVTPGLGTTRSGGGPA